MSQLRPALVCIAALSLITGLVYPLAITGAGAVLFPRQAKGSLIIRQGRIVGSELIGQHTDRSGLYRRGQHDGRDHRRCRWRAGRQHDTLEFFHFGCRPDRLRRGYQGLDRPELAAANPDGTDDQ